MAGTIAPTQNPYSWNNLTNMVWVEQPVGVGFSTGTPDIRNERQLAAEFLGFWKNFMTTFGMEGRKVYITVSQLASVLVMDKRAAFHIGAAQASCIYDNAS